MVPEITPGPQLPGWRSFAAMRRLDVNLPNLITLARLLAVPLTVWLILEQHHAAAFWIFVIAGVSDALDGYIAKRFDQRTQLGALLDPAADKTLLAGVYVTLGLAGHLPGWLVVLVILRDFLIILGFVLLQTAASPTRLNPLYISKINTLLQITLVGFVLARLGLGVEPGPVTWILVAATAATTVASGLFYLVRCARLLASAERRA